MSEQIRYFYEFEPFTIDVSRRLLLREGQPVPLKPKVFDTLLVLVENSGRVLEKDELMQTIWPDTAIEENNLNQNISAIRRSLGDRRDEHQYVVTIPGRGYRFVADVRKLNLQDDAQTSEPDLIAETKDTDISVEEKRSEVAALLPNAAFTEHTLLPGPLRFDPRLDNLRTEPRFEELSKRIGLPS